MLQNGKRCIRWFVKDFAREHLYPQIRDHVPSSTRQGRDALYKRPKENKELFRYEESEFGRAESLLADYFSGKVDLDHVLKSGGRTSTQRQELRVEQVGSVEPEIPGITDTAVAAPVLSKLEAAPPILRPELSTDKKVLTVAEPIAKLNNFQLFLALSDRVTRIEGEFLHYPHTTKLIWGSHCIVYIFTDSAGELSLYYDIELKEPLESATTGGAMFPTTHERSNLCSSAKRAGARVSYCRRREGILCPLRYHSLVGVLHVGRRST